MTEKTKIQAHQSAPSPNDSTSHTTNLLERLSALRCGYQAKRGGFLFANLDVYGSLSSEDYLETFGNAPFRIFGSFGKSLSRTTVKERKILHSFEGHVNDGELLAILGRPGSGCTTLLKTLAGETHGLQLGSASKIFYQGIPPEIMHTELRGECIYNAELDVHFPELTVQETLKFAVTCRATKCMPNGITKSKYVDNTTDLILSLFNLQGAKQTRIGDALIRGISGGEKKRVSIAEAFASFAPVQFWDNSTRGLDSETALLCIRNLQMYCHTSNAAIGVSLYQASQDILDCFDKVTVLYEGRQIFFGLWLDALEYFYGLGFERPRALTTGDFLTALTNPAEARNFIRSGYASRVPVTAEEFSSAWQQSLERQRLLQHIGQLCNNNHMGLEEYRKARDLEKHSTTGRHSSFTLPVSQQLRVCVTRGFQRVRNNIAVPISYVIGNVVMAVLVGSVYIHLGNTADDVTNRTILLFFAVLINAFMSAQEVLTVWDGRPIVEKQTKRSFYHPAAEAVSAIICDIPVKLTASILFNLVLYFMAQLRRTSGSFFTFWIITFVCQMAMSMFYRCDGSMHRTLEASMVPVGVLIMLAIIYTGFVIPVPYMKPWLSWFRHVNPVAYAFESLVINEFNGRTFSCASFIPSGPSYVNISDDFKSCASTVIGIGAKELQGDSYIETVYRYTRNHLWRNFGIILAFAIFFFALHIWSSEAITTQKPRGDVLRFLRSQRSKVSPLDEEVNHIPFHHNTTDSRISSDAGLVQHTSTIHWENVSYKVPLRNKTTKSVLHNIDGWVKPGTLTALMGATGAGKTSLLDVIAQRTNQGFIIGDIMVDGHERGPSFQRSTGYAQQNDIHLRTATVREALHFSAVLRQPHKIPHASKIAYAESVIELLDMNSYADAVIGVPGDGLSPEQRKRLTIAVELAGRPTAVLFLDEPTSGLDSQTAYSICNLLRDLAHRSGQAIMCTIHQPSATMLGMFDNLLLIDQGSTIYFGPIGMNISTTVEYFKNKGARPCQPGENPAEWMMAITGARSELGNAIDWQNTWINSRERQAVRKELALLREESLEKETSKAQVRDNAYATPFGTQLRMLTQRTFVEYWRTPGAVYAKLLFYASASFMIGISCFRSPNTLQGLQNQMFSIFLLFTTFSNVLQQIAPQFATRRALFEAREQPAKFFSWMAFIAASIIVEAIWQILLAIVSFPLFYYLTGMNLNSNSADGNERAALMLLFFIGFFLFTQSLSHLLVAAIEVPQTAINIGQPIFYICIIFCGVLVRKSALPHFWIFMYRVSPLTYLMRGMFAVGISGQPVLCDKSEFIWIPQTPGNKTCGEFLSDFIATAGGEIANPEARHNCAYCPLQTTDQFLALFSMDYNERWRDLGIVLAYVVFNWAAIFALYWFIRVPKGSSPAKLKGKSPSLG